MAANTWPDIQPAGATPLAYPNAHAIPAALHGPESSLAGLTILVTGLGVSGYPAAVHVAERGADVIVIDGDTQRDRSQEEAILGVFDVDIRRGPEHVTSVPRTASGALPDLVITSQGWAPDQPVLRAAAEAGIPVIGEVELAWRVRGANDAAWLVVTGTNGKTTTTSMLAAMVEAAGLKTRACGNIGVPLLEAVLDPSLDVLAIELASFQLHWQFSMCADAAVVLNIAADHLDWHGSEAAYTQAKGRIYHNVRSACIYNAADPVTRTLVENAEVLPGAKAVGFTLEIPQPGEFGVVDDVLCERAFIPERYSAALELATTADVAAASGAPDQAAPPHQVANALAAAALARAIDVPAAAISAGLRAHAPGAHRLVTVAEHHGVRYVDDSKATNPHAADAALAAYQQIVWIAGGLAKGADYHELLRTHAHRLSALVLIGTDPSPLQDAAAAVCPQVPIIRIEAQDEAADTAETERGAHVMTAAVAQATQAAAPGDVVLLAPAAASMDQFLNYATRGDLFARAVSHVIAGD